MRELSLTIPFNDFSQVSGCHRFQHGQFQNSIINATLEGILRDIMGGQLRSVRQIRLAMWNLARLDTQAHALGADPRGVLDEAAEQAITRTRQPFFDFLKIDPHLQQI